MEHISFEIGENDKIEFKSLCARHGDMMSVILRSAVTEYISSKKVRIVKS